jgi:hypothetical protein
LRYRLQRPFGRPSDFGENRGVSILRAQRRREGRRAKEPLGAGRQLAPETLSTAILRLQRTVGNAAVARLLGPDGGASELPYRSELETAFGEDFSSVRVSFGRGAELARLGAKASARGEQLEFANRAPSKELVAHELAHVVQSRGTSSPPARLLSTLSRSGDAAEREADEAAARARRGQRIAIRATPSAVLQLSKFAVGDRVRLQPPDGRIVQIEVVIREDVDDARWIYAVRAGSGERFNISGREIASASSDQSGADAMTGDPAIKQQLPSTSRRAYNEFASTKLVNSSGEALRYVQERYRVRTIQEKESSGFGEFRLSQLMKLTEETGGEYWRLVTDPGLMAGAYFEDFVKFVAAKASVKEPLSVVKQPWVMRDWFSHTVGTVELSRGFGMSPEEAEAAKTTGLLPPVSLAVREGRDPNTQELYKKSILDVITERVFGHGSVSASTGSQSVTGIPALAAAVANRVLCEERSLVSPADKEKAARLDNKRIYVFKLRLPKLDVIDPGLIRQDVGQYEVLLGNTRHDAGGDSESIVIGNIGNLEIEGVQRWEETPLRVMCARRGSGGGGLRMKPPL